MKKNLSILIAAALSLAFIACGGKGEKGGKETAESIAAKWCELNGKVARATSDEEKETAKAARGKYEREIDEKYKDDEAMRKAFEQEAEKCEGASEGK